MPHLRISLLFADAGYDVAGITACLAPHEVVHVPDWKEWDVARLASFLRTCDAVVTGRKSPAIPQGLVADPGRLRLLAHCHGTVKHLLTLEHLQAGIRVTNWGDQVEGVAESALALVLGCLKQVHGLDERVRSDWTVDRRIFQDFPATLRGRDVGIYGFGPIGRHFQRMAAVFGARCAIYDPYAREVPAEVRVCASLRELFSTCQVVSVHCGLNDGTRGSVTLDLLDLLPQGGVFVNTARGPIVVEADLATALASRRIVAGIDVIDDEKQWAQSALAALPSTAVLLTGHQISSGKGPDPAKPVPPKPLPQFVAANLLALATGAPLVHEITPAQFPLKT